MKFPRRSLRDVQDVENHLSQVYDIIEKAEGWRFVQVIGTVGSQDPVFVNGWVTGALPVAFRKDILGNIYIRGVAASPAGAPNGNGTAMFTLPEEYRPVATTSFTSFGTSGIGANTLCIIAISAAGVVTPTIVGVAANAQATVNFGGGVMFRPQ